jgi:hypothetical protein
MNFSVGALRRNSLMFHQTRQANYNAEFRFAFKLSSNLIVVYGNNLLVIKISLSQKLQIFQSMFESSWTTQKWWQKKTSPKHPEDFSLHKHRRIRQISQENQLFSKKP